MIVRSNDADIFYIVRGDGAPVVLLHPFPINHAFWHQVAEELSTQYSLIMPDLRGLGASSAGEGAATMQKHVEDVTRVCDETGVGKAIFIGVSIGGYILFEFWRRLRERAVALGFIDTRANAESEEGKKTRALAIKEIEERGVELFVDGLIPRLLGETTMRNRPDIVEEARRMMLDSTGRGIVANQLGMMERSDSTSTLATIDVPTLFVGGSEDVGAPPDVIGQMHQQVRGSKLRIIPNAGHYSAMEKPLEFAGIVREFLADVRQTG